MDGVGVAKRRIIAALVAGAVTFTFAACGNDNARTATPPPTATSLGLDLQGGSRIVIQADIDCLADRETCDAWSACPVDLNVCDTAKRVTELLIDGRTSELFVGAMGLPVTCPGGVNAGLDGRFPLCQGAAVGEVRLGFAAGRFQSEGGTGDAAGLISFIDQWTAAADATQTDEIGAGAVRAYTVGCRVQSGEPDCTGSFAVVLSAILRSHTRELLDLVFVVDASGESHIVAAYTGITALNRTYVQGGDEPSGILLSGPTTVVTRYTALPH